LAPSGAGLLKVKVFWRQKARVVLRLKISGMIQVMQVFTKFLPSQISLPSIPFHNGTTL
jgi:hypothetical protein